MDDGVGIAPMQAPAAGPQRPMAPTNRDDLAQVQAVLRGETRAWHAFYRRFFDEVVQCAATWTRWHPALCGDDAPRCHPHGVRDFERSACDCLHETVVFIYETVLGRRDGDGFAGGKLRFYRGECSLNTWMWRSAGGRAAHRARRGQGDGIGRRPQQRCVLGAVCPFLPGTAAPVSRAGC